MNKRILITSILLVIVGIIVTYSFLQYNSKAEIADETLNNNVLVVSESNSLDWCTEHAVPESKCTQCNPALIDSFKESGDWCAGHGIPESHCRLCNPGIEFPQEIELERVNVNLDWCREHAVPESKCTQCNPVLIDSFKKSGDWCAGHGIPESHCRLCNPGLEFPQEQILRTQSMESFENEIEISLFFRDNKNICATNDALIQFASAKTTERSGITTVKTIKAPFESSIEVPAEILFNENNTTLITSSIEVFVSRWLVSPGDVVLKDDPLAILTSSEIAELQSKLISAQAELNVQQKELKRDEALLPKKLITEREYEHRLALYKKSEAEFISARGLLLSSGINEKDIDILLENNKVSNQFLLRSPDSGVIAERIAQIGALNEDGDPLALLTKPSSLWIEAQLTEDQLRLVSLDQEILFTSDSYARSRVKGKIIWISPFIDKHTRTGTVRAEIREPVLNIRSGEFGKAVITEVTSENSVLVPKDAVQWEGCCNVVFVKESNNRFRPRKIELTDGPESFYQVTNGLSQGEEVVVGGSFLLKTELKKTSIGAGCCGIEPVG